MEDTATASAWQARESDLVERHRWGDPEAFAALYAEHERMVFNLALSLSGNAEDAADLTQEVFLRVFRALGRFRGRSSLKTWIFRIALNCCRSRLRRRRDPLAQALPSDRLHQLRDPGRGPQRRVEQREARSRVRRALAGVPMPYREAIVLRDLYGWSYASIARAVGVRVGTVRSRIARGRDRLRRELEGES